MHRVCMILRRPPYGMVDAAEAVRHALGGVTEDMAVTLILLDAGVQNARLNQDASGTGYQGIGPGIGDCLDMGVEVYADRTSMRQEHLDESDIMEGVKVATGFEVAELIKEAGTTMIF